jgi:hypothetical protein
MDNICGWCDGFRGHASLIFFQFSRYRDMTCTSHRFWNTFRVISWISRDLCFRHYWIPSLSLLYFSDKLVIMLHQVIDLIVSQDQQIYVCILVMLNWHFEMKHNINLKQDSMIPQIKCVGIAVMPLTHAREVLGMNRD